MKILKHLVISVVLALLMYGSHRLLPSNQDSWDELCAGKYQERANTCAYWHDAVERERSIPNWPPIAWIAIIAGITFGVISALTPSRKTAKIQ